MTETPGQPLVYIVVLNWNNADDTFRCLASLRDQTYKNVRIIVVDNGSADGSATRLEEQNSGFILIRSESNLGYTGGNNLAMRHAMTEGADYIWLFNNDAVAELETLEILIERAENNPHLGLLSPVVRDVDNFDNIQFGGGIVDLNVPSYMIQCNLDKAKQVQREMPDQVVLTGAAMLVKRKLIETIGFLDDAYFAYWEDIDYSIRSTAAGFCNEMVFETSIAHPPKQIRTAPTTLKPYYFYFMARNEALIWRKFCTKKIFAKGVLWSFRRQLRQIEWMPGYDSGINAVLAGFWAGCFGGGGIYNSRQAMPNPLRAIFKHYPTLIRRILD